MVHVQNLVHALRVKWYLCLCADVGSSWSRFIWPELTALIPPELLRGLQTVSESLLKELPLFYAAMVHSYAKVNDIFYTNAVPEILATLPHNLWCGVVYNYVD